MSDCPDPRARVRATARTARLAVPLAAPSCRCSRRSPTRRRCAPRTRRRGSRVPRTRAKSLNYVGTIVFQYGGRVETSRLVHLNDSGTELEKLVNLDGPAREVIRSHGEVRCYYPDAKIVRIEPRTFRNVFPSLSREQQQALTQFYEFRKAEVARVAGLRGAGVRAGAARRPALRPQVLGRPARRGCCSRRASSTRRAMSSSSSRSPTSRSARKIDRDTRQADVGADARRLAGAPGLGRRRRAARDRLDRARACRPASTRRWKASARCAASASRSRTSCSPTGWSRSACSSSR